MSFEVAAAGPRGLTAAATIEDLIAKTLAAGKTALTEAEAKTVLAAYGIPVPESAVVRSAAEAAEAARRLGGRLAMKALGAAIHHKTESGLVVLGVQGATEAAETYRSSGQRAAKRSRECWWSGWSPAREFMLGMKRDSLVRAGDRVRAGRGRDRSARRHRLGRGPARRRGRRRTARSDPGAAPPWPVSRQPARRQTGPGAGHPGDQPDRHGPPADRRDRREPAAHRG